MTLSEFKAWFEGYTEGLEGAPTKAQFDRIKEKVKEINGAPITREVYVERYRTYPWWTNGQPYVSYSSGSLSMGGAMFGARMQNESDGNHTVAGAFDSHAAMYAAGKAEAAN